MRGILFGNVSRLDGSWKIPANFSLYYMPNAQYSEEALPNVCISDQTTEEHHIILFHTLI